MAATPVHILAAEPGSSVSVPVIAQERAPRIRGAYRMYETTDLIPENKAPPTPPLLVAPPETVPLALKQAKNIPRLAQAVHAEAEEMRKEAQ